MVSGTGSALDLSGSLNLGEVDAATLSIAAGGSVSAVAVVLGGGAGGDGVATVTDAGTRLTVAGILMVGDAGNGTLDVSGGATVDVANLSIGAGQVLVSGPGSVLDVTGTITIAAGELSVLNGGSIIANEVVLGAAAGTAGSAEGTAPAALALANIQANPSPPRWTSRSRVSPPGRGSRRRTGGLRWRRCGWATSYGRGQSAMDGSFGPVRGRWIARGIRCPRAYGRCVCAPVRSAGCRVAICSCPPITRCSSAACSSL